jgi:CBS domain-containing protein
VGRLQAAAGTHWLSTESASALVAAFEFLLALRVRHQVVQLQQGLPPDNFLAPASLSADERQHLRAAFHAIDVQQQSLAQVFPEAMQA